MLTFGACLLDNQAQYFFRYPRFDKKSIRDPIELFCRGESDVGDFKALSVHSSITASDSSTAAALLKMRSVLHVCSCDCGFVVDTADRDVIVNSPTRSNLNRPIAGGRTWPNKPGVHGSN